MKLWVRGSRFEQKAVNCMKNYEMAPKRINIVHKGSDRGNIDYFRSLSKLERLVHLEQLRTKYMKWSDDTEQGFQRVYRVVRKA